METSPWIRPNRPLSIAHRGDSTFYPENTLPAYRKAIEAGVEMIECDLNLTRDGTLVMIHDYKLDRTTNGNGLVGDYTFEEIQRLDAGSRFSPEFAGTRIPSTEETLQLAKEAGIYMCFEVKGKDEDDACVIAEKLVELFRKYDAFEWAFMSSYKHKALARAKKLEPSLLIAPERLPDNVPLDFPEAMRQAKALQTSVLQCEYHYIDLEAMERFHQAGIAIWAWPTSTEESILHTINSHADGVMGDDAHLIVNMIEKYCPAQQSAT